VASAPLVAPTCADALAALHGSPEELLQSCRQIKGKDRGHNTLYLRVVQGGGVIGSPMQASPQAYGCSSGQQQGLHTLPTCKSSKLMLRTVGTEVAT